MRAPSRSCHSTLSCRAVLTTPNHPPPSPYILNHTIIMQCSKRHCKENAQKKVINTYEEYNCKILNAVNIMNKTTSTIVFFFVFVPTSKTIRCVCRLIVHASQPIGKSNRVHNKLCPCSCAMCAPNCLVRLYSCVCSCVYVCDLINQAQPSPPPSHTHKHTKKCVNDVKTMSRCGRLAAYVHVCSAPHSCTHICPLNNTVCARTR